ncbi:MAG: lipoprotein signal peptidase [Chitinophagaceae bacterium]|nr:lipoprotein signal peptidase [Chitinophagaceae bacterium]
MLTFVAVKIKHVFLVVFLVLLLDQGLKIYIKTNFFYGQEFNVMGNWFRLHFLENEGMAFGMQFGGNYGKLILSLFRLIAVIWGFFFIQQNLIKKGFHSGLIFCSALILGGALGNLLDSIFYGKLFTESSFHLAKFVPWGQGYGDLFHGKVVDMLYFPMWESVFPSWLPFVGGQPFLFFSPVFNIADSVIFLGVVSILIFQKKFLKN